MRRDNTALYFYKSYLLMTSEIGEKLVHPYTPGLNEDKIKSIWEGKLCMVEYVLINIDISLQGVPSFTLDQWDSSLDWMVLTCSFINETKMLIGSFDNRCMSFWLCLE